MSEELISKWLDDRAGLTDDEARELQRGLEADPVLAQRVKDQLATDDLLSRRLSVDRGNFETQVAQRIANAGSGGSFTQSTLDAVQRTERRRSPWRARLPEAAAAALLIAGLMFLLIRRETAAPLEVPAAARPSGLRAFYFRNQFLKGQATVRTDPKLEFAWRQGEGPVSGWNDIFSARWTGKLRARTSELHTFRTVNDDGVRIWIDGKLLIDDWVGRPVVAENRGEIRLEAGRSYDLKVEYFNGGDLGVLRLYWSTPTQNEEIVPAAQLSPE
jgi:hypothetical protein